jgi:hypothetical protein
MGGHITGGMKIQMHGGGCGGGFGGMDATITRKMLGGAECISRLKTRA